MVAPEAALEVVVQLPAERPLTDEEREAMQKCAHTALAALEADGVPEVIVTRIGRFIDEVRAGRLPEPSNQDVRLGLGVLWGEQVRAQVGWRWVHLSYPNGFASYALVPDDRAFACFPLNRLGELLRMGADGVNTSVPLFDSIRVGTLPVAKRERVPRDRLTRVAVQPPSPPSGVVPPPAFSASDHVFVSVFWSAVSAGPECAPFAAKPFAFAMSW